MNQKFLLKILIDAAGSQAELSRVTGVSESRISEWYNEKYDMKLRKFMIMAGAVGLKINLIP